MQINVIKNGTSLYPYVLANNTIPIHSNHPTTFENKGNGKLNQLKTLLQTSLATSQRNVKHEYVHWFLLDRFDAMVLDAWNLE